MLEIQNLSVQIQEKQILSNISLKFNTGEIHAIMGPNGSGKTTLSQVLVAQPDCTITQGNILFDNQSIIGKTPAEIANLGLFLSFQHPVEIPGVSNMQFLKLALSQKEKFLNKTPPTSASNLLKLIKEKAHQLQIKDDLLYRSVNDGFSGGEKKRNEILQLFILTPKLIILDEIDSGLDIDSLKLVMQAIKAYFESHDCTIIIITHHLALFDHLTPNQIHILKDGKCVRSGDSALTEQIKSTGYQSF